MFRIINAEKLASLILTLSNEDFNVLVSEMEQLSNNTQSEMHKTNVRDCLLQLQEKYKIHILKQEDDEELLIGSSLLIIADLNMIKEVISEIRQEREKKNGTKV